LDYLVCVYDPNQGYDKFEKECETEKEVLDAVSEGIEFIQSHMSGTKFEVETWTLCDGWVNCWSDDNQIPLQFDSYNEAKAE